MRRRSLGAPFIRAKLIELRQQAGLTQRQFANRAKRPQSWVAKIESGARSIYVHDLCDVSRGLGIPALRLFEQVVDCMPDVTRPTSVRRRTRKADSGRASASGARHGWLLLLSSSYGPSGRR